MNKGRFIEKLMEVTNYDKDKCIKINEILESHFIVGKRGKEKIINDFINDIGLDNEEAENLYGTCVSILGAAAKDKLRHPFKSKD